MMTRFLMTISCVLSCAGAAVAFQPPAAPNGYVPIDQLPPAAQLPAAPLLIAAYAFVLVAVLIYVWTISMTAGHFIFIPAVLLVGIVLGWILGSRAARDAYAVELRRREERASRK
jgi:hypothetical protein